jgi:hypothetical protein
LGTYIVYYLAALKELDRIFDWKIELDLRVKKE